jgi:hypothetical protein
MKSIFRKIVLSTSFPPFHYLYRFYYALVVWIAVRLFRAFPSVKAAYLRRGAGAGKVLPMVSDLDFALFTENMASEERCVLQRGYERLGRWTTILDHFLEFYDTATFHDFYEKSRRQYRFMEGRSTWKLLFGRDYMAELPERSIDEMAEGIFRETRIWWTVFAWRQIQPHRYRDETVSRNSVCYKTVAETLKMELALLHGMLIYQRKEALALSRPFLSKAEKLFVDRLARVEAKSFRQGDPFLHDDTKCFLMRRIERFFVALGGEPVGLPLLDRPPVIDCPPAERRISDAERLHVDRLIEHIQNRWAETYRGAHLLPGFYFDLNEHALLLEVNREILPDIGKLRELYRVHCGDQPTGRSPVLLYVLMGNAAFQLDVDYYETGWRSVLCPAANPDIFALLAQGDFHLDGEPYRESRAVAWTRLAESFILEEMEGETMSPVEKRDARKSMQLALIGRSARSGTPRIPLTADAVDRAAAEAIRLTVLMPCRNAAALFFRKALDSVFSQTSPLWNLIVIDDHSDDPETLGVLRELRNRRDPRVRVVRNATRMVTGALNTGMKAARTAYVCALHCDDLLDPAAVETLDRYVASDLETDYFHSSRIHIDGDGKQISGPYRARESFDLEDFKSFGPVKHLHCWKVESALAIGGMDESLGLHGADDYDFPWRMAEAGCRFRAVPECLYYYREHLSHYRLTTHVPLSTQIEELKKIFRKHHLTEEEIKEQIKIRSAGYLQQALYEKDEDVPPEQRWAPV